MSGIIGLITARGGSKAIPRKNIKPLDGRPLIAWTIQTALESRALDRVIVSTDNQEIAKVARDWGAETPFMRPPELAQDDSSHHDVVIHAIGWLDSQSATPPDYIMLLQPTSPLRTTEDIAGAVALAIEKDADSVMSVSAAQHHPYFSKQVATDGRLLDFIERPQGYLPRQSLPPVYFLNGAIYLVRRSILLEREDWYTARTYAYIMPPERSIDIDTPWDFHLAELILKDLHGRTSD
ncbi:MAG TPA: acylneuraminate cytidylyltransferase family protein [Pyrinomonadaceae bacterium]|nr:acylneuraminate cytidylyltransferase family protein [Pyrinomonadaceae bacterium]